MVNEMPTFQQRPAFNDNTDVEGDGVIDLERLFKAVMRQRVIVAAVAAFMMVVSGIYAITAVPMFTATSSVMIDKGRSMVLQQLTDLGGSSDDETTVLSQIEVFRSQAVGYEVVDRLKLVDNAEFMAEDRSIIDVLKSGLAGIFGSDETEGSPDADQLRDSALSRLQAGMDVERVGQTYIINISYTSPSPELSAKIATGIAEAYLRDSLNSKYEATRRASKWLQERIAELEQKALQSDLAVERFRASNGLLSTGNGLVTDQNLAQINSALGTAQSQAATARARYEEITKNIEANDVDAVVKEVLDSPIANNLREQYLLSAKSEAEISARLGPNHEQAVRHRRNMAEYKALLFGELGRIAQSYNNEAQVADGRVRSLLASLATSSSQSAVADQSQVKLRELQREAETYRNLYQSFLQRYQQAIQQQSFSATGARIISRAAPPLIPSSPKLMLSIVGGLLLGGILGGAIGALREFQERFYRTGDGIREDLGKEFLGMLPLVDDRDDTALPVVSEQATERSVRAGSLTSRYSLSNPLSSFAETLRSAKIAVDFSTSPNANRIVGIASTLPDEGKSTVAVNFARLLASQGHQCVLIDADLRSPGATRMIAPHAKAGLVEVLLGEVSVEDALMTDPLSGMKFMPTVLRERLPFSAELLVSPAMRGVFANLLSKYEYIVLDLPPVGAVVDARALSSTIDSFVYVVEWGRTARRAVRNAFQTEEQISRKCAGVILSKVDQKKMRLYSLHGDTEYYASRYSSYYEEAS